MLHLAYTYIAALNSKYFLYFLFQANQTIHDCIQLHLSYKLVKLNDFHNHLVFLPKHRMMH